mmetsp:Transcript_13643/g.22809  ORF Transcript_13643/g.22809 Transcript_13643/m.22809 type:complete len:692 (-) Transcript_13643:86-2161(-)|eukprot:CAMPEP_0184348606 /NCGR_PEP_ID=MMETSP1089-20130417/27772_1 /TAXON_ID=38269 ORGANISM="Gloeochaete wittrockiana, Strain SAG46.84" /NCGR_SAMPLE_ID=MMETSP1089 /ASSEMBLY_ACC=CAM_ASM_000445 /LENGTH=691 /DNA_ID=CAMNT_0026680381 /DNA_START=73 /DNA_END=2151 /DNA_ORIENTATION=-
MSLENTCFIFSIPCTGDRAAQGISGTVSKKYLFDRQIRSLRARRSLDRSRLSKKSIFARESCVFFASSEETHDADLSEEGVLTLSRSRKVFFDPRQRWNIARQGQLIARTKNLKEAFKDRDLIRAREIFEDIKARKLPIDVVTYGILTRGACDTGDIELVLEFYNDCRQMGVQADSIIYGSIAKAALSANRHDVLQIVHDDIRESGISVTARFYTSIIEAYLEDDLFDEAVRTLDIMEASDVQADAVLYGVLVDAFMKARKPLEARALWERMHTNNIEPDDITVSLYLSGLADNGLWNDVKETFQAMLDKGYKPTIMTYTILIRGAADNKDPDFAQSIVDLVEANGLADRKWNTALMANFARTSQWERVVKMWSQMKERKDEIDMVATAVAIKAAEHLKLDDMMAEVREYASQHQWATVILESSYKNLWTDPFVREWNSKLANYFKHKKSRSALACWEKIKVLRSAGSIKIDESMYGILVKGFLENTMIEAAEDVLKDFKENGSHLQPNVRFYNNAMTLFVRASQYEKAIEVFELICKDPNVAPDIVSFTALINAYISLKRYTDALAVENLLKEAGTVADSHINNRLNIARELYKGSLDPSQLQGREVSLKATRPVGPTKRTPVDENVINRNILELTDVVELADVVDVIELTDVVELKEAVTVGLPPFSLTEIVDPLNVSDGGLLTAVANS